VLQGQRHSPVMFSHAVPLVLYSKTAFRKQYSSHQQRHLPKVLCPQLQELIDLFALLCLHCRSRASLTLPRICSYSSPLTGCGV
jgi:hypothetical protein